MKRILVVSPNYPYKGESFYPFVKNLCDEFSKLGYGVTVLSPQSITSAIFHGKKLRPIKRIDEVSGNKVTIYQPYSITPSFKRLNLYNDMIRWSVLKFLRKYRLTPDVCYCHFWCSAYYVLPYMQKFEIPMIVASGESEISLLMSEEQMTPVFKDYVKGVVCVSTKNQNESIAHGLTTIDKCEVFPNSVDSSLFYKQEKRNCRDKLGLPHDEFIVVFVGWFIERKGPCRVADALSQVSDVKSVFIGRGNQDPKCDGILFKGALPHEQVPVYLGAADVFVLPTLHEGCCNAVVEAMACGLPVISSNLPFNWDILDESNSIMIDPNNIDELAEAIRKLKENVELRNRLADGALKKAEILTIEKRASAILDFIKRKI